MQRFKAFLTEAVNYEEMFNSLWKAVPEIKGHELEFVKGEINWARKTLKRSDRIVWYLQWIRVALVSEWGSDKVKASEFAKIIAANPDTPDETDLPREVHCFLKRILPETHTELEHFFSMNIPAIESYRFVNYVSYENTIHGQLRAYEDEYMDGHEASIPYVKQPLEHHDPAGDSNSGITIIKQFPNEYYWVDLKKSSCRLEGDASGHCGNTASNGPTETVLSFRKLNKRGKDESTWLWEPHMTFILDKSDGMIGEMKGRNNKKPNEEYHKYIIPLLLDPLIKGIKGGGYAPEENFSLADLTDDQREKLFNKKPALMSITDYFKKLGKTPELIEKVNAAWSLLVNNDSSVQLINLVWDDKQDHAAVAKYVDIHDFTQDFGNDTAKWCDDVLTGGEIQDFDAEEDSIESVLDMLDGNKVEAYLQEKFPTEWEEDDGNSSILEFIDQNDYDLYSALNTAAGDGLRSGAESDMSNDFKNSLRSIDVTDSNEYNEIATAYIADGDIWDQPMFVNMTFKQIYATVTDDDSESGIRFKFEVDSPRDGWQGWDKDAALEYMKQEYEHLV
jgi:hypothetical protein